MARGPYLVGFIIKDQRNDLVGNQPNYKVYDSFELKETDVTIVTLPR